MDPTRFHWLESRFAELAPLEVRDRERRLAELRAAGAEDELVAKLERMIRLAADPDGAPLLALDPATPAPALPWREELDGTVGLGPFRLVRRIGEGGMGEVYEAVQAGAVERRVAIKVLKQGVGGRAGAARFQLERQALALLEHPNIARLYEAGTTDDGRPFFAMELVDGLPITRWCDQHALALRPRLELFLDVCRAVQHAHRQGIVHRDLKPSNVLVAHTGGPEGPQVKVIDFGIAKLVGGTTARRTPAGDGSFTREGELVGTPEYMSPEQLSGEPARIDLRTDVYSLGVMLFELLVGQLPVPAPASTPEPVSEPHAGAGVADTASSGGFEGIRRRILEQETPRPSSRLLPATGRTRRIASSRGTDPRSLVREIRGDLDWVVLKALARERDERYESPSALAADLEAHLAGEAVAAGPPSLAYRTRKLIRRHRLAFAAAALVVLGLVASTVIALFGLDRARAALEQAQRDATSANQVTEFLIGLFEAAEPGLPNAGQQTARELLDAGAQRVARDLDDSPIVRSRLLDTLGRIYVQLGSYEQGRVLLEQGLELREQNLGIDDPRVAESLTALGYLEVEGLDRPERAIPLLERADAILEAGGSPSTVAARLRALDVLSHAYQRALRYEDAERVLARAMALARATSGARSREVGDLLNRQGILAQETRDWEASVHAFEEARSILREVLGSDHVEVAVLGTNLGWSLVQLGRPAEALPLMKHELAVSRAEYGERHQTVADTLLLMAPALTLLDRLDEAALVLEDAREIYAEHLGEDHYAVAEVLYRGAELDVFAGDTAAARARLGEVLERLSGSDHLRAPIAELRTLEWLAHVERAEGRFGAAREACARALLVLAERLPATERSDCGLQLAWIDARQGRIHDARRGLAAATAATESPWSIDRPFGPISRPAVWAALGDFDAAFEALEAGLDRGFLHPYAARNRDLAPLRSDPRFERYLAEVSSRLGVELALAPFS
ncbi:MAG TPA: serine/threonine-protein kinase [Thermoanaerobaculia bacterium]|nr:serine/threonine-protein kinase [Thermoanaerobaculia bacterium]